MKFKNSSNTKIVVYINSELKVINPGEVIDIDPIWIQGIDALTPVLSESKRKKKSGGSST